MSSASNPTSWQSSMLLGSHRPKGVHDLASFCQVSLWFTNLTNPESGGVAQLRFSSFPISARRHSHSVFSSFRGDRLLTISSAQSNPLLFVYRPPASSQSVFLRILFSSVTNYNEKHSFYPSFQPLHSCQTR